MSSSPKETMMPEKADEREEEETNLTNRKAEDVPRCPFSGLAATDGAKCPFSDMTGDLPTLPSDSSKGDSLM
ncbi:hypothetical protein Pmar_PMAR009409 [Perkinsus marinus ATCC 50983]|uniref:Uncharacterized protein n=1 Tax=Perkinsus marinus (strain ATCC 50983 / TXsc) TaxID=423536 RepID=C5KL07_PERM5|nr:hypothetical protein Pmar_PMAR009409 [Perkinsus marinus ATCC 50983]EER14815.1 hypothetical protein Pmar_PMAR009409 [Perkinsus marinus ATCC 50983]|eukprot:XP_002783019.1 hypothetical protein Pmar_PMAR009409 [Perkinsus marinus ATCC 50983]